MDELRKGKFAWAAAELQKLVSGQFHGFISLHLRDGHIEVAKIEQTLKPPVDNR